MKNTIKVLGIIAFVAIIGFSMAACNSGDDNDDPVGDPDLSGEITINPSTSVFTGTELTATYSGTEEVSYQWHYFLDDVGTNVRTFSPSDAGGYSVTVSAEGYNSKRSARVTVLPTSAPELSVGKWTSGSLPASGTSGPIGNNYKWFKFTATADTQYIHFNKSSSSLVDIRVSLYDNIGGVLETGKRLGATGGDEYYFSKTVTSGNAYYIMVYRYSTGGGSFSIGFTDSTTTPTN